MNRFYQVVLTLLTPFVHILFPMKIEGVENLPEGGALICPNHSHAADPVLVAVAMGPRVPICVMGKAQLFRFPPLGWLFRKLGAFPVERGGNDLGAIKTALKGLQSGKKLLIFPEGTRVDHPGETGGKGGAVLLSLRSGTPLVPVYCGGRKKFLHRNKVIFGKPYLPTIAGRRPTPEENQAIAAELMERIYALGGERALGEGQR